MAYRKKPLGKSKEMPTRAQLGDKVQEHVATMMYQPKADHDSNEDEMIEALDEKMELLDILKDIAPVLKRIRRIDDVDAILESGAPIAAKLLMRLMIAGDGKVQLSAIQEVLNRHLGKPIERQMNLNADVGKLQENEVDRQILRLIKKVELKYPQGDESSGEEGVFETSFEERKDS